jgi:hypothetical protein
MLLLGAVGFGVYCHSERVIVMTAIRAASSEESLNGQFGARDASLVPCRNGSPSADPLSALLAYILPFSKSDALSF